MRKLTLFAIFLCMTILASGQGSQLPKYTVATLPSAASLPNYIVQVIDGINGGDCIIGGATGSSAYNVECTAHNGAWVSIGGGGAVYPAGTGIPQVVGGASWAATYNSLNQIPANFINLSAYSTTAYIASTYQPLITLTTTGACSAATFVANVLNIPVCSGGSQVWPTFTGLTAYGGSSNWVNPTYTMITSLWAGGACSGSLNSNGTCTPPYSLPSTVVQTNQANTYTTGLQDFSSATVKMPTSHTAGSNTYTEPASTGTYALTSQLNSGTVTAVSVATANGVSGSSSGGATPALTISLGAITPTSTNGVTAATMAFVDPTSSIQTQLNGKQASGSYALTTATTLSNLTTVAGGTFNTGAFAAAYSLPGTVVQTNQTNTFGAFLQDFSGSTHLKHPIAAGYASAAAGEIGYDSTNLNWHAWANGGDNYLALLPTSGVTSGHCAQFLKSANAWTITDAGGACTTGGSMVWPGTVGIPYWTSGTAWGGAYNNSTPIPANYLPAALSSSTSVNGTTIPASSTLVTAVSVATANGVSGSSSGGTTPALTISLGAITPTSVNGNIFTTGSSTYTGTAGQTYTFPTTTSTLLATNGSAAALTSFPTFNQDTTGKSAKTDALNSATTIVNVSSATAPTNGQVLTATGGTAATWQTPTSGGANALGTYIVQTATNAPTNAQILASLGTGILKNTITTGVLSIAGGADLPAMSATVGGAVPTPPNDATKFLNGTGAWTVPAGGGSQTPWTSNINAAGFTLIGNTTTTGSLNLQSTSGVGTTGANINFLVGNNGATNAMTILNSGKVGIGTAIPNSLLQVGTTLYDSAATAPIVLVSGSGAISWPQYGSSYGTGTLTIGDGSNISSSLFLNTGTLAAGANYPTGLGIYGVRSDGATETIYINAYGDNYASRYSILSFGTEGSDAAIHERMRLDGNGNVGVGITTPSQLFTVKSTGSMAWDNGSGTADTGLSRISANLIGVGNGTPGDFSGTIKATHFITAGGTSSQFVKGDGSLDSTTYLTGSGTGVTAIGVTTANGVSGSSSGGATPSLTISLGAITPTSTNGVTAATMAFVDPTSSVQTQLNTKAPTASPTFTGTVTAPVISYGTGWNANSSVSPLAIGSLPWGGGPGNPVVIDAGMNSVTSIQVENDSLNPAAGAETQTPVGGGATFGSFGTNGPDFFQNLGSNIGNSPNTIWGQGVTYVWGENGPVVIGESGAYPLCFQWQIVTLSPTDNSCQLLADTNGVHFQNDHATIAPALTLTQVIKQTALTFTAPTTLTSISGTAPNMTITGTFPGGGSNAYANWAFILEGTTHAADVQAFICSASTTTTLTCDIPNAVAETFPGIAITGVTGTAPGILSFTNTGNNGLTSSSWANFLGFSGLAANLNGTSFQVLSTGLTATTFQVYIAPGGITTTGSSSGVANSAQLLSLATTTYVGTITGGAHNGYGHAVRLATTGFVASSGVNNQSDLITYASSATAIATRSSTGVNETQAGSIVSQEVRSSTPVTFDSTYNTGSASATDRVALICVPQSLTANPAIICTWTHTGSSGGETMAFQNPITTTSTINGATVTGVGTTGTITGTALTATCDSGTASVTGAVVGHPVAVSSTTGADVGGAFNLRASVTSAATVTVYICGTGTPASLAYNVTVF